MTASEKRKKVVDVMVSWLGKKEADGSHKSIIDLYNSYKPLARGYKVKYSDSWCMTTVSAAFIKAGLADICPLECSCPRAIEKAKEMGIWVENDAYTPSPADIIMYDWQDNGKGDNTGNPDHTGIVRYVRGNKITVIEGNKSDAVAERELEINGRYIRGYITPKFGDDSKPSNPAPAPKTESKPAQSASVDSVLKKGSKGAAVGTMQTMLNALGYYSGKIDNDFGSGTEAATKAFQKAAFPNDSKEWDGKYGPKTKAKLEEAYKNRSIKSYATIQTSGSPLRLRNSAGTRIGSIPNGAKVTVLQKNARNMNITGGTYSMTKISYNGAVGYVANKYLKY